MVFSCFNGYWGSMTHSHWYRKDRWGKAVRNIVVVCLQRCFCHIIFLGTNTKNKQTDENWALEMLCFLSLHCFYSPVKRLYFGEKGELSECVISDTWTLQAALYCLSDVQQLEIQWRKLISSSTSSSLFFGLRFLLLGSVCSCCLLGHPGVTVNELTQLGATNHRLLTCAFFNRLLT